MDKDRIEKAGRLKVVCGGKPDHEQGVIKPRPYRPSVSAIRNIDIPLNEIIDLLKRGQQNPEVDIEQEITELLFRYRKAAPMPEGQDDKTFYQSLTMGITQQEHDIDVIYYGAVFTSPMPKQLQDEQLDFYDHTRELARLLHSRPDIEFLDGGTLEWYEMLDIVTNELHIIYRFPCLVKERRP